MRTIAEVPSFVKVADSLMGERSLEELKSQLAKDSKAGDLIAKTSGMRKIRGKRVGSGKRGGVRVYYYPCKNQNRPIYLIACIAKADDRPLSSGECKTLSNLALELENANIVDFMNSKRGGTTR